MSPKIGNDSSYVLDFNYGISHHWKAKNNLFHKVTCLKGAEQSTTSTYEGVEFSAKSKVRIIAPNSATLVQNFWGPQLFVPFTNAFL